MERLEQSILALLRVCLPLFGLVFAMTVVAATELEHWRDELTRIRALAENDVPLAYQQALQLQSSASAGLTPADQAHFLNLQARIEIYFALMDKAAEHIKLARNIAVRHDDKIGQIEADLNAALNLINQGKIDELIAVTTHSMTLLEGIDNPLLLSEAMLRVGMMYRRIGQFDESVTLAMQAMEAAKQGNDPLALAYAYQGLAIAFDQSGRYQEATEHYAKMREQAQRVHSKMQEGFALIGMGNVKTAMGDKAGGERLIREGITLHRVTGAPFNINFGLFALSDNLRKQGRFQETITILNEVLTIYEKYHNRIGLWYTLNALSGSYQSLAKMKAAQASAERADRLAKDIGFSLYLSESAKQLARLATSQGNYQRAYELLRKSEEITEKSIHEKNSKRMLELAERYQTESKQREIEALTRRNEQQSGELRQKALQQNLLSTVLGGSTLMLFGTAFFLLRLRRSHRQLASVNLRLQHSQKNLQHQTGILQSILDSMGDGVSVVDEHGDLMLINPVGEKILGLTMQDFEATERSQKRHFYLSDTVTLFPQEALAFSQSNSWRSLRRPGNLPARPGTS